MRIGNRVHQLKWQGAKKPTVIAATEFDCSVRKVEKCYNIHRKALEHYQREKDEHDFLIDEYYETRREAAIESLKEEHGDREFTDEEIEAEAEELDEAWRDCYSDEGERK